MNLFQSGEFRLRSGVRSEWKIECDALCSLDWFTLALMAVDVLPKFRAVYGVPRGGLPFAAALEIYATGNPNDLVLIADDVYTTGGSLERFRATQSRGDGYCGIVAFARAPITQPWIRAVFQVIEHVPDALPTVPLPPEPKFRCRACNKPTPFNRPIVGWYQHGWTVHKPICRHPDFYECPKCQSEPAPPLGPRPDYKMSPERRAYYDQRNCPVCGCNGMLT